MLCLVFGVFLQVRDFQEERAQRELEDLQHSLRKGKTNTLARKPVVMEEGHATTAHATNTPSASPVTVVDAQEDEFDKTPNAEISTKLWSILSTRGHVFYYPWYGNTTHNKEWLHWNHVVIPASPESKPTTTPLVYQPPDHIGANFYPALGLYSSTDPALIHTHMKMIRNAGLGVISVSWYPPSMADEQIATKEPGFTDSNMRRILTVAELYGIKVNLHIEPYKGRGPASIVKDLKYVIDNYGSYSSFYRHPETGLPLFYLYDSYLTPAKEWATVFGDPATHPDSIRDTPYNAHMIALLVDEVHFKFILDGGFDGCYTYFATDGFTFGSSTKNWKRIAQWANDNSLLFIPSVGPGYADTRIRPWNGRNQRSRRDGQYYEDMWKAVLSLSSSTEATTSLLPSIVSVTSWNEWHEGTQIEPAVPKTVEQSSVGEMAARMEEPARGRDAQQKKATLTKDRGLYTYLDYQPRHPEYYMEQTKEMMKRFCELHGEALEVKPEGEPGDEDDFGYEYL
ncbi:Glycoprotein endo-alpha-1,2-mannosidase [Balamuthia mandrillaris]